MNTDNLFKKLSILLAPILGAGGIDACPLCWAGSASLLTYLGLGALIPVWRWITFGLIALGAVLLYVGRYVFLSTWGAWQIWGPGAVLIVIAVIYNRSMFRQPIL